MMGYKTGSLSKKILSILKRGVSPHQLALGMTLGVTLGIIPLLGISSFICLGLAWILRLNIFTMQIANYAVYPLQILLLAVYYSTGAWLFGDASVSLAMEEVTALFREDMISGLGILKEYTLHALWIWALTSPPIALLLYLSIRTVAERLSRKSKMISVRS